ncbi:MAG: Gfo/Idh/MocA family oxidoreductase [Planctomycetota bacterium]
MTRLHFGICGLGCMGRSHFARLRDHPQAEVVAVCDRDARRRAGDWDDALGNLDLVKTEGGRVLLKGIRAYATPQELIADPDVDVVLVTLPTVLHAEVAVAALRAGKHVLCEKPMALRPNDCNRMVDAARAGGRTLMIAQCLRFWPQYETIRRSIDAGDIGAVRFAVLRRLGVPPTYSAGGWLLDAQQSGGALLDLHVHDVDFAHDVFGIPQSLYARGSRGPSGDLDHVVATWGYADGRYVLLEGGWVSAAPWSFDMEITVHGERGTLGWAMSRGTEVVHQPRDGPARKIASDGDALRVELDYFIECVRTGRPVERCRPESTRLSVVLAWLERRSIETARVVPISERLRSIWSV